MVKETLFDKVKNVTIRTLPITLDSTAETAYTYDKNGNLIQKSHHGEHTLYSYDYDNMLTSVVNPNGSTTKYTYDANGRRVKQESFSITVDGGPWTVDYLYDGNSVIIEKDGSGNTTASYTRGLSLGGGIGSIISKHEAGKDYYYLYDAQGNVTHLTDSSGKVIMRYEYDAFGNIVYQSGSLNQSYQYQTKEYDSQSGLVYFGARYYDPTIGHFTTPDPLGMVDGPNQYLYCSNNPIGFIDPWGLCKGSGASGSWDKELTTQEFLDWWHKQEEYLYKELGMSEEEFNSLVMGFSGGIEVTGGKVARELIKRNLTTKSRFLKSIIDKSPKWMKQWLLKGKNPPGYEVHHYEPLYKGGKDTMENMRLIDKDMHDLITKIWRLLDK